MLTDTKLRNLKPKDKLYKVNDRDGLYVAVTPAGSISFHYNYSIHGRQETITFGRCGIGGITLAEAQERLGEAKKMIAAGKSSAKEKARDEARVKDAETFGAWAEKWLRGYQMADSTRDMRRSVFERELKHKFGNQKLTEITHEDLRALTDAIIARGALATAVHAREIVLQVYRWAIERGQKVENPAELVRPTFIARFELRDRALTPDEEEAASGKSAVRPELEQCRKALRGGDTLVVWRLDRLGRSLPGLAQIVTDLEQRGVGFESLTEKIETGSVAGKLIFHVFAALAEFERGLIRARTQAGLAAARARGRAGGRKPKLDEQQVREIKALLRDPDIQVADVARRYGVSRTTIYKHCGVVQSRHQ